ncbi:hypothetical protein EI94DRAFT_1752436 [Lactarius quietus]|nr:hypothetical protein EI94DRAFT_1752436 [Lactarius quietus]
MCSTLRTRCILGIYPCAAFIRNEGVMYTMISLFHDVPLNEYEVFLKFPFIYSPLASPSLPSFLPTFLALRLGPHAHPSWPFAHPSWPFAYPSWPFARPSWPFARPLALFWPAPSQSSHPAAPSPLARLLGTPIPPFLLSCPPFPVLLPCCPSLPSSHAALSPALITPLSSPCVYLRAALHVGIPRPFVVEAHIG